MFFCINKKMWIWLSEFARETFLHRLPFHNGLLKTPAPRSPRMLTYLLCCLVAKSLVWLLESLRTPAPGSSILRISQSLLKLMSIELVMPSNHLTLCCPLLLLPSVLPASRFFPMSCLFVSGGQSIAASASASVLPINMEDWFSFGLTGWISLQSKGLSSVFSRTTIQKHQFFHAQPSLWSNSQIHILTRVIGNPLQYYCLGNTMDRGT